MTHVIHYLRNSRPDKGYKGCTGAVTDITIVRDARLVVSTSLDRQIRVHKYETKELLYKQYLTSKLTCVLVQTETSTPLKKEAEVKEESELREEKHTEEAAEVEEDDMDKLFDDMETVGEKTRKKKLPIEPSQAKKHKPSTDGSTMAPEEEEDTIFNLLRSTEKQKKKREKKKKEKKAKSVFHNA